MNDVYQAMRAVLPPDRFAKVKREQIVWLKSRDAANSIEEKSEVPNREFEPYKSCSGDLV